MKCGSSGSGEDSEKDSRSECSALGIAFGSSSLDISGRYYRRIAQNANSKVIIYNDMCFALEECASRASRALESPLPILGQI